MTLLRLKDAAATYFAGTGITAQTLRGEARKGRLEIVQIGKRDYVSPEAIEEMIKRCRHQPKAPTSSSTRSRADSRSGSSATSKPGEALDALNEIERELKENSTGTGRKYSRRTLKTASLIKLQLRRS